MNNVVGSNKAIVAESEVTNQSSTKIAKSIKQLTMIIGDVLSKTNTTFQINKTNIAVAIESTDPKEVLITVQKDKNNTLSINTERNSSYSSLSLSYVHQYVSTTNNTMKFLSSGRIPTEAFENKRKIVK